MHIIMIGKYENNVDYWWFWLHVTEKDI